MSPSSTGVSAAPVEGVARTADGTKIAYDVLGSGPPLLLVSGQGGDRHNFDPVRPGLAAHFTTIAFDHRGTGRSDAPTAPPYTTRLFAGDAIAVLDAAGVATAPAFGLSMGGRIGQWLGIEHGDRISALVLGCTTPGDAHGVPREPVVAALMTGARHDPRGSAELGFSPGYVEAHPELLTDPPPPPLPPAIALLHWNASQGHDAWDRLPEIAVPTLVLHGDDDPVNPTANAALLADRIPGAVVHYVHGGRHAFHAEFPEETVAVVTAFLTDDVGRVDGAPQS